jgi:hypothetical protein
MNRDTLLSVGVTLSCVLLLVVASSTLASTVSTSPSEAVTLDYESLPVDGEDVATLSQEFKRDPSGSEMRESASDAGQGDAPRQTERAAAAAAESESSKSQSAQSKSAQSKSATSQSTKQNQAGGGRPVPPDLLDRLLRLLEALLSLLVELVPVAAAAAVLGLAIRYRRRLLARFGASTGRGSGGEDGVPGPPNPANDVEAAWYEMVRIVGLEDRTALTPREKSAVAREESDAEAVATLTRLFEEVTYGGEPITEDRRRRARHCVRSIRARESGRGQS